VQEASLLPTDELEFESGQSSVRVFPRRVVATVATLTIGTAAAFAVWTNQSTSLRGTTGSIVSLTDDYVPVDYTKDWDTTPTVDRDASAAIGNSLRGDNFMDGLSDEEKETIDTGVAEAASMENSGQGNMLPMLLMSAMMGQGPSNDSMVEALQVFQKHLDGVSEGDLAKFFESLVGDLENASEGTEDGTDELAELYGLLGGLEGGGGTENGAEDGTEDGTENALGALLSNLEGAGVPGGNGGDPNRMAGLEEELLSSLGRAPDGDEDLDAGLKALFGDGPTGEDNPFLGAIRQTGGHGEYVS